MPKNGLYYLQWQFLYRFLVNPSQVPDDEGNLSKKDTFILSNN